MLTMAEIENSREMYFNKGFSISRIAREVKRDRKTIRNYLLQEDWNENPKGTVERSSKIDRYKATIDEWLEADRRMRKKQRHTARRVYDRLRELHGEEFDCSYRTVAGYVAEAKERIYGERTGFLPLEHKPGESQVDFGKAEFIENGTRYYGSYLNLSFPYSNSGFLQLFKGENFECLGEGLENIYTYLGGIPYRQWFDNASTMVTKILKGGERSLTESFLRFKEHHGFEAVFCNRGQGNEKGSVENKVGYHRRNLLVPIPEFTDLQEYNKELLERCMADMDRLHYRKETPIATLFEEDRKALVPLPSVEFDVCSYETVKTDAYGKFSLEKGRHIYSSTPKLASRSITVVLRAHTVTVLDENMREVIRHARLYGQRRQEAMDWIPYLKQLSRYPAALKYSGIYTMLPDPVQGWLDRCSRQERSKALKLLAELTENSDFATAAEAFRQSVLYDAFDLDSVVALHCRMTSVLSPLESIPLPPTVPQVQSLSPDVKQYDLMLKGGVN
jgi:transposase